MSTRVARNRGKGASGIVFGEGTKKARRERQRAGGQHPRDLQRGRHLNRDPLQHGGGAGPVPADGVAESRDGIVCLGLKGVLANACVVAGNTVRDWPGSGLVAQLVSRVQLLDNTIEDVGRRGIHLRGASDSEARGNSIARIGQGGPGQFDGIEIELSSHNNRVVGNTVHKSPAMRAPIRVGPGCLGNLVEGNFVLDH